MLFHREIGFPSNIRLPVGKFSLSWGNHAKTAAKTDRNGVIRENPAITIDHTRIVEIEMFEGRITKILYRTRHDSRNDVVYALKPEGSNTFFVKTVWLNRRGDKHKTLNRSIYQEV